MKTEETTQAKEPITHLSDYLGLTQEQTEKLTNLVKKETQKLGGIQVPIEIDADSQGYAVYNQEVPTIIPIHFNGDFILKNPDGGTWELKATINGNIIFQGVVKKDIPAHFSGWTGWGTSKIRVEGQWSEHKKTHLSSIININIG